MSKTPLIRVKVVGRNRNPEGGEPFINQCPGNQPQWGNCRFHSDPFSREYDWLVVRDDLSPILPGLKEELACPRTNTILITSEPSSITRYGKHFASQFKYLITNQDAKVLPHPNALRMQTGSVWFYGKTYDQVIQSPLPEKTGLLSAIATDKRQKHTIHQIRFDFTKQLADEIPEADLLFSFKNKGDIFDRLFNGKARFVEHKYDMIDPYKYHLAVGNQTGPHILTERIFDAFLGYAVPVTYGCTNLSEYFPENSFIEIDIFAPDDSIKKIEKLIHDPDDYSHRLESVKEARRRVLEEYNIPAMLSRIIEGAEPAPAAAERGEIYTRRMMRVRHPSEFIRFALWRGRNFLQGKRIWT